MPDTPFIDSGLCKSKILCRMCRANAAWRAMAGAPDVCPNLGPAQAVEASPAEKCVGCLDESCDARYAAPCTRVKMFAPPTNFKCPKELPTGPTPAKAK